MSDERLLTEAELELMTALWDLGEGTVRDVMAVLPPERAYTTVSTLLRILEQKGFVTPRAEGRRHVYVPAVPREGYERRGVRHLLSRLFRGDAVGLVRRLVEDDEALSEDALRELRHLVDEKLRDKP